MRPRMMRGLLLAIATSVAPACGGGDSAGPGNGGDVEAGRFTAELSGSFSQSLSGPAFYAQQEPQGEEAGGFAISMSSDAQGASGIGVVLARENSSLPPVGEYRIMDGSSEQIAADDFIAASFWNASGGTIQCFSGDPSGETDIGGSLTLTASGSNVVGEFTTNVDCLEPGTGQLKPAKITGTFNATAAPAQ